MKSYWFPPYYLFTRDTHRLHYILPLLSQSEGFRSCLLANSYDVYIDGNSFLWSCVRFLIIGELFDSYFSASEAKNGTSLMAYISVHSVIYWYLMNYFV